MDAVAAAWIIAAALMTAVLIYAWGKTRSFGRAWIASLLLGKLLAGMYYVVGLDRPWITLVFRNGARLTITIAEAMFLLFLSTLVFTVLVVVYGRILPSELRKALEVEG